MTKKLTFAVFVILIVLNICLMAVAQEGPDQAVENVFGTTKLSSSSVTAITTSSSDSSISLSNSSASFSKIGSLLDKDFEQSTENSSPFKSLGILDLEEHIASGRFKERPGIIERAMLVRVYERIVLAVCFPSLAGILQSQKVEHDVRCDQAKLKLSELHSNNTILICAEKGVESVDCARSFEDQAVRKYKSGEYEKLALAGAKPPLDSPEIKERFLVLQKKLLERIDSFKKQFSIQNLKSLDSSLFPVLAIICADDNLELTKDKQDNNFGFEGLPNSSDLSLDDAINSLGQGRLSPSPTATPLPAKIGETLFYRSRILSDNCNDTIVDVLNIDSRISSAICFRDGFISPSCISSLRRMQSLRDPTTPGIQPTAKGDGLASF